MWSFIYDKRLNRSEQVPPKSMVSLRAYVETSKAVSPPVFVSASFVANQATLHCKSGTSGVLEASFTNTAQLTFLVSAHLR